jgi:hypothetical protein
VSALADSYKMIYACLMFGAQGEIGTIRGLFVSTAIDSYRVRPWPQLTLGNERINTSLWATFDNVRATIN